MSGKRDEGKYRDDNDDEDGELFMQVDDFKAEMSWADMGYMK